MHVQWAAGTVVSIDRTDAGIQYVSVRRNGEPRAEKAVHYIDGSRPLQPGDEIIFNTTAVDLGLGSGGSHFVAGHLHEVPQNTGKHSEGHIMKLRYTPWQFAVLAAEEEASPHHNVLKDASTLSGMPVLAGELHSMLPILVASLRYLGKQHRGIPMRIVYIMTDGAALPLRLSRHVRVLRDRGWLDGTVTVGHAYGGDLEAVNVYSGLLAARHVLNADAAIVLMGPGIVGTGTKYGFSGIEQGQIVNAVHALNGTPIVVPRVSFAEERKRHRGLSHHTITNLTSIILRPTQTAIPVFERPEWQHMIEAQMGEIRTSIPKWMRVPLNEDELAARLEDYPLKITSMGRGWQEDTAFFLGVSCAADVVWQNFLANERRDG